MLLRSCCLALGLVPLAVLASSTTPQPYYDWMAGALGTQPDEQIGEEEIWHGDCRRSLYPTNYLSDVREDQQESYCPDGMVESLIAYFQDEQGITLELGYWDGRRAYMRYEVGTDSGGNPIYSWVNSFWSYSRVYKLPVEVTHKICPPEAYPEYTYAVDHDGDTKPDECLYPSSFGDIDSCPNVSDGNYILPVSSFQTMFVTSDNACLQMPDGSNCGYRRRTADGQAFYERDFEFNCYAEDAPEPFTQTPELPTECTDYDGAHFCPMDPEMVCNSAGACQPGCGWFGNPEYPTFGCFSPDTDEDGIPDITDPDDDNDGIFDDDDPDSDGDGQDDAVPNIPGDGVPGDGTSNGGIPGQIDFGDLIDSENVPGAEQPTQEGLDKADDLLNALNEFANAPPDEFSYTDNLRLEDVPLASKFQDALPEIGCQSYEIFNGYGIDLCEVHVRMQFILYWLFAMLTSWRLFTLMQVTLRGKD